MKKTLLKAFAFLAISCFVNTNLSAQNVGINATGAAPDGGAMLDIAATNKGLLIPRVNIANLATIAPIVGSATTSMLVYNTNATTGQGYYYWDGAQWVQFFAGNIPADNGLYFNAGAGRVRLGGPLVENTTITQGAFGMTYNLNGTGDFNIQDNGTTHFQVRDNGLTYFGDDTYWNDGSVTGTTIARLYDSGDDGVFQVYLNGALQHNINSVGASVFNEQGTAAADFRIESDAQANIFFVDAGTNEIGIRTAAPGNMLEMTNGGQAVGANSMANFENQGADGVALAARNTSTTSGYNAFEGITDYTGNAFTPAGVFGLAISGSLTHSAIGVRGAINGRNGIGVLGTRQSGVGTVGWGGLFLNNLGYTGGFFNASDRKLKKDISDINNATEIIKKLRAVSYYYDIDKYPNIGLNQKLEYGFIAQELKEIIPNIVEEMSLPTNGTEPAKPNSETSLNFESFYMVDYTRIIPILTKGIQEQQEVIDQQNQKIEALEKIVLELQKKMNQ